mmetsp:Transcript_36819/g.63556  ORF Transcript_36819/g.63556 Transcript_36819/m.63556 type:complete len:641 (-) Transcript_36819:7-1929(-)
MDNSTLPVAAVNSEDGQGPVAWPEVLTENFGDGSWPDLSSEASDESVEAWVQQNGKVLIRTVTWNLCAEPPPIVGDIQQNLLPKDRFHIYIIGTEECERSIAQSALFPSKKGWEAYLNEAMGPNYVPIRSHTLQAIHLMAFVHRGIAHLCSAVTSAAVPTGMGSTLGNKGGVGLYFKIGATRFLVVNAHLAAHQTAEKRRNAEFNRINKMIPVLLEKRGAQFTSTRVSKTFTEAIQINDEGNAPPSAVTGGQGPTAGNDAPPLPVTEEGLGATPINASFSYAPAHDNNVNNTNINVESGAPLPINGAGSPSKTHSVDLSVQHMIPSVETIVDQTGQVLGEVDEYYPAEAVQPANEQPAITDAAPVGESNIPSGGESAQETVGKPLTLNEASSNHNAEHSNTDAAVGSVADADNSFTPLATTPTTTRAPGAISTSNSNQAIDALADEANTAFDGDVNVKNRMDGTAILDVPKNATKTLENSADLVVFMGDLNYRIKGNRKIVSSLVANNMHEVLLHNDQLAWNMNKGLVLQNFTEGPLHFKPTYKYDLGSEHYDTSSKGRIPSWTDRILFVPRPGAVQCLAYQSDDSIRTSDHRPVFASFQVAVNIASGTGASATAGAEGNNQNTPTAPVFSSESQVCTIM